jgi:hypothetical protein
MHNRIFATDLFAFSHGFFHQTGNVRRHTAGFECCCVGRCRNADLCRSRPDLEVVERASRSRERLRTFRDSSQRQATGTWSCSQLASDCPFSKPFRDRFAAARDAMADAIGRCRQAQDSGIKVQLEILVTPGCSVSEARTARKVGLDATGRRLWPGVGRGLGEPQGELTVVAFITLDKFLNV